MHITQESEQFKKPETLAELEGRLKIINSTIDKLNNQRVTVLHKIHKAKQMKNVSK